MFRQTLCRLCSSWLADLASSRESEDIAARYPGLVAFAKMRVFTRLAKRQQGG